jgi:uncharacterized phiE125 gp8 family phage protein
MDLIIKTAPTVEPVTLDEVKRQLRIIDETAEDTWLTSKIPSARERLESYHGWAYVQRTYEGFLNNWPCHKRYIEIPKPPLASVTSILYYGEDGTEYTFTDFIVNSNRYPGRIVLKPKCEWPTEALQPEAGIKITFVAGYAPDGTGDAAANVPQFIKDCICALVNCWYEDRNRTDIPKQIIDALAPSRMWPI